METGWGLCKACADQQGSCSFVIRVYDTELPILTCPANIVVTAQPGTNSYPLYLLGDSITGNATDNSGTVQVTSSFMLPEFSLGSTGVILTAVDPSRNTDSCGFLVTVVDTEPPSFISCPIVRSTLHPTLTKGWPERH